MYKQQKLYEEATANVRRVTTDVHNAAEIAYETISNGSMGGYTIRNEIFHTIITPKSSSVTSEDIMRHRALQYATKFDSLQSQIEQSRRSHPAFMCDQTVIAEFAMKAALKYAELAKEIYDKQVSMND